MAVRFADVTFTDGACKVAPVYEIFHSDDDRSPIAPRHDTDFDKNHLYAVKWFKCSKDGYKCLKNHKHVYGFYAAKINNLAETPEEFEALTKARRRISIPKRKHTGDKDERNPSSLKEIKQELQRKNKLQKTARNSRSAIELSLAQKNMAPSFPAPHFNDSDEDEDARDDSGERIQSPLQVDSHQYGNTSRTTNTFMSPNLSSATRTPTSPTIASFSPVTPPARHPSERGSSATPQVSSLNRATTPDPNTANLPRVSAGRSRRPEVVGRQHRKETTRIESTASPITSTHSRRNDVFVSRDHRAATDSTRRGSEATSPIIYTAAPPHVPATHNSTRNNQRPRVYRDGYGGEQRRRDPRAQTDRSRRNRRCLITNCSQHYYLRSGQGYRERKDFRYKSVPGTHGEQIYLSEKIPVDHLRWSLIMKENDKIFIETTTDILWTDEEIIDLALDTTQVKNAIPGRAIKPIDRERLLLLLRLYYDYLIEKKPDMSEDERIELLTKALRILSRYKSSEREKAIDRYRNGDDDIREY